jgi:hypothetical protein
MEGGQSRKYNEKELYFKNYNYIMKKINFPGFHCSACVVLVVHCGFQ